MTGSNDQTTTDPLPAALADNGGLTWTQATSYAGPARDAGDDDESCSTGGGQSWLWLGLLALAGVAVLRPRRA